MDCCPASTRRIRMGQDDVPRKIAVLMRDLPGRAGRAGVVGQHEPRCRSAHRPTGARSPRVAWGWLWHGTDTTIPIPGIGPWRSAKENAAPWYHGPLERARDGRNRTLYSALICGYSALASSWRRIVLERERDGVGLGRSRPRSTGRFTAMEDAFGDQVP